jgi:hypothetical protein
MHWSARVDNSCIDERSQLGTFREGKVMNTGISTPSLRGSAKKEAMGGNISSLKSTGICLTRTNAVSTIFESFTWSHIDSHAKCWCWWHQSARQWL